MSMHADEESDEGVVPMKRSNNEGISSAETVEGKTSPKGNGGQTATVRTQRRDTASNGLEAVRQAARQSKTLRFTALLHHITTDLLKRSYLALARDAAPGIDGVTWQAYGESLEEKLKDLRDRVHRGSYRARPARRTYIPKADGSKRPLNQMLKGYLNYYAVSGNSPSLWWYFNEVRWRWLKSLKRRSQRAFMSWEKFTSTTDRFFPSIRILHPLPCHRFDVRTRGRSPVR
jgi:hypothetical protein